MTQTELSATPDVQVYIIEMLVLSSDYVIGFYWNTSTYALPTLLGRNNYQVLFMCLPVCMLLRESWKADADRHRHTHTHTRDTTQEPEISRGHRCNQSRTAGKISRENQPRTADENQSPRSAVKMPKIISPKQPQIRSGRTHRHTHIRVCRFI